MIRKLLTVAAAAVIPMSAIVITSGVASAGGSPPVPVTGDNINCTSFAGSTSFSPPLTPAGTGVPDTVKFKGTDTGCTDTTNPAVTIASGKVSGTFMTASDSCSSLAGGGGSSNFTGTLTAKWKTTPKTTPTSSSISPLTATEGVNGGGFVFFTLAETVTGAFSGATGTGSGTAVTNQNSGQLGAACSPGGKGIKKLVITGGAYTTS